MKLANALKASGKFANELNQHEVKGKSYFPAVNGVVHVSCEDFEGDLKVFPEVFVCSAMKDEDGNFYHELHGQAQAYMVTSIFTAVHSREKRDSRAVTCLYLQQLEAAIERGDSYVETILGWKFIDWASKPKVITASRDWKNFCK